MSEGVNRQALLGVQFVYQHMAYKGYKRTPNVAYWDQKRSAVKRGIGWQFTYKEWVSWWEANLGSDWFRNRGHHTGQHVMARNGDKGPYAPWNVRCAKVEDNHNDYNLTKTSQANKTHRKRLHPNIVKAIYVAHGPYASLAKKFGLDVHSIHRVKCQKAYKAITEKLEKGCSG